MRLVIDGRRLTAERTGVGRYLECLLAEWAATGPPLPRTLVVLHDPSGLDRLPRAAGIETIVVGAGWPGLIWERFGLGRALGPGDVLFAPTNLVPSTWRGPTVLVVFDTLLESRPGDFPRSVRWRFRGRYRAAARRADRVIVPSEATARDAGRFYGLSRDRMRVVPPCVGPSFRPAGEGSEEVRGTRAAVGLGGAPYFLFVGKRSRRRHVAEVLAAFSMYRRTFPGHRMVFVGPGGGGIDAGGVIEAGHVAEPVLRGLMAGALALIYPSELEGFGLPVVEAMACGCPVVALRRDALQEAGGEAADWLDEAEPSAIAGAMARLATDRAFRDDRVRRGLEQAGRFPPGPFAMAVAEEIRAAAGLASRCSA